MNSYLSYHLVVQLDANKKLTNFVREEFVAFLKRSSDKTRESVLSGLPHEWRAPR